MLMSCARNVSIVITSWFHRWLLKTIFYKESLGYQFHTQRKLKVRPKLSQSSQYSIPWPCGLAGNCVVYTCRLPEIVSIVESCLMKSEICSYSSHSMWEIFDQAQITYTHEPYTVTSPEEKSRQKRSISGQIWPLGVEVNKDNLFNFGLNFNKSTGQAKYQMTFSKSGLVLNENGGETVTYQQPRMWCPSSCDCQVTCTSCYANFTQGFTL